MIAPRITPSPVNQAALLGLDRNAIMWCDGTVQPGVYGCQRISPACGTADNTSQCYAEVVALKLAHMAEMQGKTSPYAGVVTAKGWTGEIRLDLARIATVFATLPKKASAKVRRLFVTSMSDLFHVSVTFAFLDAVFAEMAARPWLVFQVLTKRAARMAEYAADRTRRGMSWPANVHAGVTVEDQRRADERIPHLLRVPAAVRFLSIEPMLGAVDLDEPTCPYCGCKGENIRPASDGATPWCVECDNEAAFGWWLDACASATQPGINWVIIGSESNGNAPGARETRDEWVLDLVDQCDAAGVPAFVKQLDIGGKLCALPMVDGRVRAEFPSVSP